MTRPRVAALACALLLLSTAGAPLAGAGTLDTFLGGPTALLSPGNGSAVASFPNPARAVNASVDLTPVRSVEALSGPPSAAWGFMFAGCATAAVDPVIYRQSALDLANLSRIGQEDGSAANLSTAPDRPGLLFEVPVPSPFLDPRPWNVTFRVAAATDGPQPPGGGTFQLALFAPPGYIPWLAVPLAPAADNASVLEGTVTHPGPVSSGGGEVLLGMLVPTNASATELLVDSVNATLRRLVLPESPQLTFAGATSSFWQFQTPGGGQGTTLGRAHGFQGGAPDIILGSNGTGVDGATPAFSLPAGSQVDSAFIELVPEPFGGSATSAGGPTTAGAGGTAPVGAVYTGGFPVVARPVVANVALVDVFATGVVDASQEVALTTQVIGNTSGVERAAAQTFTVESNGTLAALEIDVASASSMGLGKLRVQLRDVNGSQPGNTTLATADANQTSAQGDWYHLPLSAPVNVTSGQRLAIVVTMDGAVDGESREWRRHDGLPSDPYAGGGAFVAANASGLGGWTEQADQDFTFRVLLDTPLDPGSVASVSVAGSIGPPIPTPLPGNRTEYVYTVPGLAVGTEPAGGGAGRWNVTIGNALPSAVRFNWSVFLDYALYPRNVRITVGGEAPAATLAELDRPYVFDIAPVLGAALASGNFSAAPGPGGSFHDLTLRVRADGPAPLRARALDVAYGVTLHISGFSAAMNQRLAATNASAPLAEAAFRLLAVEGEALLANLSVVYSQPPVSFPPADATVDEGAVNVTVHDLLQLFADDFDTFNLTFAVVSVLPAGTATAAVHRTPLDANLTVTLVDPEFSGILLVSVLATDTTGLSTLLAGMVVNVRAVDDPPVVPATLPDLALTGTSGTLDLSPYILDNDTALSNLTVSVSSPFASVSGLVLSFDYHDAPASLTQEDVTVTVTDGTTTVTTVVKVLVENAGRPTVDFGAPGAITVRAGRSVLVNLSGFATDNDDVANLSWELLLASGNGTATLAGPSTLQVTGTGAGAVTVTLSARDRDLNLANGTLVVAVLPNEPPRFTALDGTHVTLSGDSPRTIDLAEFLSDPDDPATNMTFNVAWDNGSVVRATVDGLLLTLTRPGDTGGHAVVTITVSDPSGATAAASLEVDVEGPTPGSEGLLLLVAAAVAAVALGAFFFRSYRRGQADRRSLSHLKREEGSLELDEEERRLSSPEGLEQTEEERMVGMIDEMDREAGAQRLELPPVTVATPPPGPGATTSLLLLYRDGRPVAWLAGRAPSERESEIEQEVAAAVGERLKKRAPGARIEGESVELGGRTFAIEARSQLVLVARVEGGPKNQPLRQAMRIALDELFDRNSGSLRRWDGSARSVKGVDEVLEPLMGVAPTPGGDPAPAPADGGEE